MRPTLKKLLRQRLDAAVIDKLVLAYLKATDDALKSDRETLQFDEVALEDKTLFLCFRGDDRGQTLKQDFNRGLDQVNVQGIVDDYFARAFAE